MIRKISIRKIDVLEKKNIIRGRAPFKGLLSKGKQ